MCGIAGKYIIAGNDKVSHKLIEEMCNEIAYRGPDDSGVMVDGAVGLGHRRLSIIDLSPKGHQPMESHDGRCWIVFNGEIYNFSSHRADLQKKGYVFSSNTDTEVILNLYLEYGTDCLSRLRGMFAFAIWDSKAKTLFLARDRIGKKPLYYYFDGKRFLFASELKSILCDPIVQKKVSTEALCDYFRYSYVPDPKTIFADIFKLEPGHYMLCSQKGISRHEYWDVSFAECSNLSLEDLADELLDLLKESVRLRLVSDVPLGAFLSGGVDSSAIVALMALQSQRPVKTCSIGFASEKHDETQFARKIAESYQTEHREFVVRENVLQALKVLVHVFDEPFADPSSVPTYFVSKLARQQVTVALSGDGGDESFAGYEKYHTDAIENRIRKIMPAGLRHSIFPLLANLLREGHCSICRKGSTLLNALSLTPDYAYYLTNSFMSDQMWQMLARDSLKLELGDYDPYLITRNAYRKADTDDHLSRIMYTDIKTYLAGDILVKVDRTSMANSLEVRAPLLDHKVVEFAATIPSHLKYLNGEKKIILKKAFAKLLSVEIMNRKKMGFSPPLGEWFRGELKELSASCLLAGMNGLEQYFQPKAILKVWENHQDGKVDNGQILWSLLMFELWHREYILGKRPLILDSF